MADAITEEHKEEKESSNLVIQEAGDQGGTSLALL
jgi:hypothetical protein